MGRPMHWATKLLVAAVAAASPVIYGAGLATSATVAGTALGPGTIVDHVFVKPFALADGALSIAPFHGVAPTLTPALATIMWSTDTLGGDAEGIGFGVVTVEASRTINDQRPRVTSLVRVPAFVALADANDLAYSCPVQTGPGTTRRPVSNGWRAVIFPLNLTKSDAVFEASSNICGHLVPNTIATAYETLSVRWHLSPSLTQVVVSVPACATMQGWGGGGNVNTGAMSFEATVLLVDRPLGQRCSAATNFDAGGAYASSRTTHGPTGPQVQVNLTLLPREGRARRP